jgi:hypothetical protein
MSREQRRLDRKQRARGGAAPSRRTPVRAPGSGGINWVPIGIAGGTAAIIVLIVYLVWQSTTGSGSSGQSDWEKAEADADPSLPGVYVPSQGRGHLTGGYTIGRPQQPFCPGVPHSDIADTRNGATPVPTSTPTPVTNTATVAANGTVEPTSTPPPPTDCHLSNPPTSGRHLGVQRPAEVMPGVKANIPPDPDVYPDDVQFPRDSIAHILEHAGVFVGWNCADGDQACLDVVQQLKDLVNDRIDNHDDRVVMARDDELPVGEIGLAAWTRVMNLKYQDYDESAVTRFISTHSCRFDPEGFCG